MGETLSADCRANFDRIIFAKLLCCKAFRIVIDWTHIKRKPKSERGRQTITKKFCGVKTVVYLPSKKKTLLYYYRPSFSFFFHRPLLTWAHKKLKFHRPLLDLDQNVINFVINTLRVLQCPNLEGLRRGTELVYTIFLLYLCSPSVFIFFLDGEIVRFNDSNKTYKYYSTMFSVF